MTQQQDVSDTWTIRRILQSSTQYLAARGADSARLESEILLAHVRECKRIHLYTDIDEVVTDEQRAVLRDLIRRRGGHEPVAYLVGHREFFGLEFAVSRDVLIPRHETETLVEASLSRIPKNTPTRILEIGTGSGCIAITLAKLRPLCHVVTVEISEAAIAVAHRNTRHHKVQDRVEILHGSLFEPLEPGILPFDGLVSNPPYITEEEITELPPDVRDHEPLTALTSGQDGLKLAREIAAGAASVLKSNGWLALELAPEQMLTAKQVLESSGLHNIRTVNDLNGAARVLQAEFTE